MWRVENSARRHGVGCRAEIERRDEPRCCGVDWRSQGHVDVAAAVMVMTERGFSPVVGDIESGRVVRGRIIDVRVVTVAMILVVIMGDVGGLFIGNAGELETVLYPVLAIDHAMHLHRDHDGHAQADAKEAEQALQIEIPRPNSVTGKRWAMQ